MIQNCFLVFFSPVLPFQVSFRPKIQRLAPLFLPLTLPRLVGCSGWPLITLAAVANPEHMGDSDYWDGADSSDGNDSSEIKKKTRNKILFFSPR